MHTTQLSITIWLCVGSSTWFSKSEAIITLLWNNSVLVSRSISAQDCCPIRHKKKRLHFLFLVFPCSIDESQYSASLCAEGSRWMKAVVLQINHARKIKHFKNKVLKIESRVAINTSCTHVSLLFLKQLFCSLHYFWNKKNWLSEIECKWLWRFVRRKNGGKKCFTLDLPDNLRESVVTIPPLFVRQRTTIWRLILSACSLKRPAFLKPFVIQCPLLVQYPLRKWQL